jgi:tetratricopeptide (TPR) repeat protein
VSGRVHRVGDHIQVGAELVNPSDDIQIWGTEYDLDGGDLSRVEDIAQQIAEQVGSKLNVGGATTPARHRVKPQAYELLLRGQYQRRLYTPESRQKAVGYFEAALAADPQFALAHAELANTFRLLAGGGILDPADAMPRAEAAAQRALAADDNLAEAHAAMADVLKDRWDWSGAEQEYRRAIALNPSFVDAHMQYAILLSVTGRYPAALLEVQKVRALDPVGLPGAIHAASVYYNGRHYADALAELARARALDPSAPTPHMWMAMTLSASGRFADAVTEYREAISRGDTTGATRAFYAYALAKSGAREQAEEIVRQLVAGGEFVPLTALAVAYAGLDQPDRAVALLRDAYAKPDPSLQYLKVEAHFDSIKDRPDYANLAARLRLP